MLGNSIYTSVFGAIFLSDNCYYEKYSDGSVKNIQDEIPFDIPEGWSWSRATSILILISGQDLTPDKYNSNNIGIPYIMGASNFENGHITINRWTEFPQAISIMGDILLTCKGTIGEMAINIIGDTHIARQIMALRGSEYINNGYLELVMQSEISSIIKKADGLIPGISRPVILELLLPIAPSSEQLKIVESTKILLQNVNDINLWSNEIETIKSLIKSKVLELAIQGKLVPQDENDEPASVLLERIRAERKAKLGKKYIESYIYKGDDTLNYIVDFTEADFAQKLVDQINSEIPQSTTISEEKLNEVAKKLGISSDDLFDELYVKHYIDRHYNIKPENRDAFFAEYPDFTIGLESGKVKDRNKQKPKQIKIRKAVYDEIKKLWETLNKRYLLFYDSDVNSSIENAVLSLFENEGIFSSLTMSSERVVVHSTGTNMELEADTGVQYTINHPVSYGVFLKRISSATNLPIRLLHEALCEYVKKHGEIDKTLINESSIVSFCRAFSDWKNANLQSRFNYKASNMPAGATALTYADGKPRNEITQGRIGTKLIEGTPCAKYLYDTFAYDSPLEKANITTDIEEVIVYGKIPRSSIAIPTITGGMYSPDFMYVVKKANGQKELNVVIETKDVEGKTDLRGTEAVKIKCAEIFFDTLKSEGYDVKFRTQLGNRQMKQIIQDVLGE